MPRLNSGSAWAHGFHHSAAPGGPPVDGSVPTRTDPRWKMAHDRDAMGYATGNPPAPSLEVDLPMITSQFVRLSLWHDRSQPTPSNYVELHKVRIFGPGRALDFASYQNGAKLGETAIAAGARTSDDFAGPNCYDYGCSPTTAYSAGQPIVVLNAGEVNANTRPTKNNFYVCAFDNITPGGGPHYLVIDFGQPRTFNYVSWFNASGVDGACTHAALHYL